MWIVITVVVIISFAFFGGYTQSKAPGQTGPEDTAFTMYGKSHTIAEMSRLQRVSNLASMLQLPMEATGTTFANALTYIVNTYHFNEQVQPDFVFNLLVLRHELEKNGIYVSDDEAREAFRNLDALKNQEGKFDPNRAEFIQNQLGSMGFRLPDLYDLMRDWVGMKKLIALVSGNIVAQQQLSNTFYANAYQNIKASSIPFARETYQKDVKVPDEEISKYFEEKKDTYKTEEKRALEYVYFANPDTEKLSTEERTKAVNSNAEKINNFAIAVIAPNANFEEEAKKAGVEVKKLPAFAQSAPPEAFKEESRLIQDIFNNVPAERPVSDPVQGSKGFYIFKVTEVMSPAPQKLEDVKEKIRETLVAQKADEAMTKAVNEARQKLEESIKGGKSFTEAAKEAGLSPQTLPDFTPANPPADLSNGFAIAQAAAQVPAKSFAEPVQADNGLLLVYVNEKSLYKRDDSATLKTQFSDGVSRNVQLSVFRAWFERRREESKLDANPIIQRALGA